MRARITIAFVAILAVALLLAGAVGLLLVRNAENNAARVVVLSQARAVVRIANSTNGPGSATINNLVKYLQAVGANADAPTVTKGRLTVGPVGISPSAIDVAALANFHATSGVSNGLAFAIVPLLQIKQAKEVVAFSLTTKASTVADNLWYFLLAGGISLLVAGLVAAVISERISRHVVAAASAAEQIAQGDLATRVPVGRDYPELERLGNSINTMAAGLERARHLEREFLLSVSHDLRTPLTSIRGYAEAIADGLIDDAPRAARVVIGEASRLERLIGDLLDLAKIDARQFSLHQDEIEVGPVLSAAAEAMRYVFEVNNLALDVTVPDEPIVIIADPDRLGQVLGNLIENALKFASSTVLLSAATEGSGVRIEVADDGPGIDADDLQHVFVRHFRSSRHAARAGGSGLGLAIVAELTSAMGGTVVARSPNNGPIGTTMTLHFPTHAPTETRPLDSSAVDER